jgi:hypothetical protein
MKASLILVCAIITASAEQLRITVYDDAKLNGRIMDQASDQLRRIFRQANIETVMVTGDPAAAEGSLIVYTDRRNPQRRHKMVCRARRDIALNIVAALRGVRPSVLGMALPLSNEGLNVRIFADRVSETAFRENRPFANVLAHAIAHEVGHVLLRTEAHEHHGIMAGFWTTREYDHMTASRMMLFTREQSARMRDTLAGTGCEEFAAGRPILNKTCHSVRLAVGSTG